MSGVAGMTAALRILDRGGRVTLVEKEGGSAATGEGVVGDQRLLPAALARRAAPPTQ